MFADLRPYVCLSKDCTASETEFMRRREWVLHETQNHWRTYPCPCACGTVFPAKALCQEHVSKIHSDAFSKDQVSSMIDLSSKSVKIEDGIHCLLCKEPLHSMEEYQRHAGRHQEQLALFALPPIGTDDDDAQMEEDVSGTHSNLSSDAHREQLAKEDEHASFGNPLEDDIDQIDCIMLEGATPRDSEKPSALTQKDSQEEREAPAGSKWTKISRRDVSPEALEIGKENFELSGDFVLVLRVLSPEEIERYASATRFLREKRRREEDTVSDIIYEVEIQSKEPSKERQPSPMSMEHLEMSRNETEAGNEMKTNEVKVSEEQGEVPYSLKRPRGLDQTEITYALLDKLPKSLIASYVTKHLEEGVNKKDSLLKEWNREGAEYESTIQRLKVETDAQRSSELTRIAEESQARIQEIYEQLYDLEEMSQLKRGKGEQSKQDKEDDCHDL